MKVKTYQTRSIKEAVELIKRDFGPDAMILGTRPLTTRKPWGIRRQSWEVTAGPREVIEAPPVESPVGKAGSEVADSVSVSAGRPATTDHIELRDLDKDPAPPYPARSRKTDGADTAMSALEAPSGLILKAEARIEEVLEEIDELKRSVRLLGQAMPQRGGHHGDIYTELVGQSVDPEFAENLLASAARLNPSPGKTRDAVRALLGEMFSIDSPEELLSDERVISVFVGPTGVGKTTTIAKIAGHAVVRHGKNAVLISTDSQRVTGQEQLLRYGQLLGITTFKCPDLTALKGLVESLGDYDLVLIDTAGCSPSDRARLGRLESGLSGLGARVRLVLSATTKSEDVSRIYKRFHRLSPESFVLTKMDETETRGSMVGELLRFLLPLSYLSEGQHVPEDLWVPNGADLARLMLPIQ